MILLKAYGIGRVIYYSVHYDKSILKKFKIDFNHSKICKMSKDINLFSPFTLRGLTFPNRLGVAPMDLVLII